MATKKQTAARAKFKKMIARAKKIHKKGTSWKIAVRKAAKK